MKLPIYILLLSAGTAFAATEEHTNRIVRIAPGGNLVVDVDQGSIDVGSSADDNVSINVWRKAKGKTAEEEGKYLREHPVTVVQDGDTITIRCRHKEKNGLFHWGSETRTEAKYTIRVPSAFNARLDTAGGGVAVTELTGKVKAATSGGNLQFIGVHGPLNGETSGGGIRLADCAGEIKIETSGGNIDVSGGSGSLKAETSGGGVQVRNFDGPAAVESSGGDIAVENVKGAIEGSTSGGRINAVLVSPLPGNAKFSTSGGDVTVNVADNAAFDLDAETSAGRVTCDLATTPEGKNGREELKGKVNGGGPAVRLRTSAGMIQVKKL